MTALLEAPPRATRGTTNRNARGGSVQRLRRKVWLLEQADLWLRLCTGELVRVAPCHYCRVLLTLNEITVDRIVPGCDGGTYRRDNIRAACGPCNSKHGGALRRSA